MPDISLTQMVDFVSKAGSPEATCVRNIKAKISEPYDPAHDLYKIMREGIIEAHASGDGKPKIAELPARYLIQGAPRNTRRLELLYTSWWGRKNIAWSGAPPRSIWTHIGSAFGVTVNPELGLNIDGTVHIVKLYFKAETLTKASSEITAAFRSTMEAALGGISGVQSGVQTPPVPKKAR